jgi:hypothetical protein
MHAIILLTLLLAPPATPRPPTTAPARSPAATAPAATEPLVGGALRYAIPQGWDLITKRDDGRGANYKDPSGKGVIMILVDPLSAAVPKNAGEQMAPQIGNGIREAAQRDGNEITVQPRADPDDRYLLKIHDRQKLKSGQFSDRVQYYRVFGTYLVSVASTAFTDDDTAAKEIHKQAEQLLDQMRIARGVRPTVFGRTQIKLTPPVDWKEQKRDQPNGIVATYTDERNANNKTIIRAKIVPKPTAADPAKRQAFLDKMIDDERQTEPFSKTALSADESPAPPATDEKSLRKIKSTADANGQKLTVISRYIPVGDVLVSVRSISPEPEAEAVTKIADDLAATLKPPKE